MDKKSMFDSKAYDASAFKQSLIPEELRLGNYLETYVVMSAMGTITTPIISKIKVALKDLEILQSPLATYRPIPLTPEILEKAGFKFDDMGDMGVHIFIVISNPDLHLSFNEGSIWIGEFDTKTKYIHQLQNLFFSLTGEELEINL